MDLFLIDGIGPFFRYAKGRINWSKIPFADLEKDGELDAERMAEIRRDFAALCSQVAALGYNAITLDDVAHLARWPGYSSERRRLIERYRSEWAKLFEIAREAGLGVFLTSDVMFFTPELERELGRRSTRRIAAWLERALTGMRKVLRALVPDGASRIVEGERALPKIRAMIELAGAAGAPRADLEFQLDTFEILSAARRYYFDEYREELRDELVRLRDAYVRKHAGHYHVHLDFRPLRISSAMIRRLLGLLLRRRRGYRVFDRLVTLRLLGLCYPVLRPLSRRVTPDFAEETAMGVDAIFR
ncbi:MAG TPA: hypothetical protein VMT85_02005 [Thermoanaerobaculia bacterium]|nr:hypothetical protein [Thermoanaerobaculia bacterium]